MLSKKSQSQKVTECYINDSTDSTLLECQYYRNGEHISGSQGLGLGRGQREEDMK